MIEELKRDLNKHPPANQATPSELMKFRWLYHCAIISDLVGKILLSSVENYNTAIKPADW